MKLAISALVLATAWISGSAIASAAAISYSDSYGPAGLQEVTDWSGTLTLPGFNRAFGTLTSVTVTLADNGAFSGTVTNTAASPENFSVSETIMLTAAGAPLFSGLSNDLTEAQSFAGLPPHTTALFGPFGPSNSSSVTDSDAADFGFFEGANFSSDASTLTDTLIRGGGGNILTAVNTTATATMTVKYDYTPAPIPEPASLAFLGTGLIVMGLVRRRTRQP